MRHSVAKEVEQLAALKGINEESIAKKYDLYGSVGYWEAGNRASEAKIGRDLADAKAEKAKADSQKAFEKKLASGAVVWRKVGGEWMVQVTGREVNVGDLIDVERRDGTSEMYQVKSIVARRDDGTFCRV